MIELAAPPGLILIAAAAALPALPPRLRDAVLLVLPALVLALVWTTDAVSAAPELLGHTLHWYEPGLLGRLFASVFLIVLFVTNLYALRQSGIFELSAANLYAGGAVSVVLCGDFLTLLIFWEVMLIGSAAVIFAAGTAAAARAGMRYLLIHLLSGVLLMLGILGLAADGGDLGLHRLTTGNLHGWLILAAFLINAGAPPLSAWVADAYPRASAGGMVYLSAYTTKTAVFALLVVFPGEAALIPLGLYMIFYGILYALNENDMRRILAYSIVNQVGFMVTGIGIGTELALNGAALHAFAHILYKALLLMSAGGVLVATGRSLCTELGGLHRSMPITTACGIIGALAISAAPLTSGFVTKPMIEQASLLAHMSGVGLALTAASAGVFLHAGIKFPWFVFFHRDAGLRPAEPPLNMRLAMMLCAALCLLPGFFPEVLYQLQPWAVAYEPYTAAHVVVQCQLLLFAGLAFFVMLPLLRRTRTITIDVDWLYRRLLPALACHAARALRRGRPAAAERMLKRALRPWLSPGTAPVWLDARSGTMVMLLTALLLAILFLHY